MVLKAELHCHLEGASYPELVLKKARQYGVDVSQIISKDNRYVWNDFRSFIKAYDLAASVFRTEDDFADLAEDMYLRLARQHCIYGEVFVSPDHAAKTGVSCDAMVDAVADGISRARDATGIEGRMIIVGVRHEGVEAVNAAAKAAAANTHPWLTGFGIAGDERAGSPIDFAHAFQIAKDAGLGTTGHAGELSGADSVRGALDHWQVSRIGHGVRAIEDPDLVKRIADEGVVLEICPGSNVALNVFESFEAHPFRQLQEAGCIVTLNSDDPPYFHTSLDREYEIAGTVFEYDDRALTGFTKAAIEAAFIDEETRTMLLEKCEAVALS